MTLVLKQIIGLICLCVSLFSYLHKDKNEHAGSWLIAHVKKTSINRTNAAISSVRQQQQKSKILFSRQSGHRKIHIVNHFSFDATEPSFDFQINSVFTNILVKNMSKYGNYHFLFFKKINPPPPKFC